jgi:hypothetical protein
MLKIYCNKDSHNLARLKSLSLQQRFSNEKLFFNETSFIFKMFLKLTFVQFISFIL